MRVTIGVEAHGDTFHIQLEFLDEFNGRHRSIQIDEAVRRIKLAMNLEDS